MEHVYNGKENTKYLKLLKQNYSSSQAVIREIVNLTAITNLPKGTEFFLSDIHVIPDSLSLRSSPGRQIFP